MNLHELDIVYFVKDTEVNEELKYSLRSIEKNFIHRNVVFVGGKPDNLTPDRWVHVKQDKETKWDNTSLLLRTACEDERISSNFILFNDDFFVLQPIQSLPYYTDGPLGRRIHNIETKYKKQTSYSIQLRKTKSMLEAAELPTTNYAVHFPMIINKQEMLDTFRKFPNGLMWRSLYGNYQRKHTTFIKDCKIYDDKSTPDEYQLFVSTKDSSFKEGEVGRFIRSKFPNPCKYESL